MLRGVLIPLLQPEELSLVFGQVVSIYATMLADAYDALQLQGTQAEQQARCGGMGCCAWVVMVFSGLTWSTT